VAGSVRHRPDPIAALDQAVGHGAGQPGRRGAVENRHPRVADRLVKGGYRIGTVTNASGHGHTSTTVAYGSGRRSQAEAVAQLLGATSPDAVRPLDAATRTAARGAAVVVTVGSDSSR
jgi:hypothetical protein